MKDLREKIPIVITSTKSFFFFFTSLLPSHSHSQLQSLSHQFTPIQKFTQKKKNFNIQTKKKSETEKRILRQ